MIPGIPCTPPLFRRLACGALLVAPLTAWGDPPHYRVAPVTGDWAAFDAATDAELTTAVKTHLTARGITTVARRGPDGGVELVPRGAVRRLGRAEQMAVLGMIGTRGLGAEWDMLVRVRGETVPVTVWWDAPKRLDLRAGAPWDPTPPPATVEALLAYGIGPLGGTRGGWEPEARGLVEQALAALRPEELAVVGGVELWRQDRPSERVTREIPLPEGGAFLACYERDVARAGIYVFDAALRKGTQTFVGRPEAPSSLAVYALLHEVGHALADAPARAAGLEVMEVLREARALEAESQRLRAEWETLPRTREGAARAETLSSHHEEILARMDVLEAALREREAFANDWTARDPMAAAWSGVLGGRKAPTLYGRTAPIEGFADAFALHHLDPEALRRASPVAASWFDEGGPARVLAEARVPAPVPPPPEALGGR